MASDADGSVNDVEKKLQEVNINVQQENGDTIITEAGTKSKSAKKKEKKKAAKAKAAIVEENSDKNVKIE